MHAAEPLRSIVPRVLMLSTLGLLAACVQPPKAAPAPAPEAPPQAVVCPPPPTLAPPPVQGLMDVIARPAEGALMAGLRAYDEAQYPQAEQRLNAALKAGLASNKDRAAAHKTLAFVYCSSKRIKLCEAAFRAARDADPAFVLSKAEAGHPVWGPVYRRVLPAP